MSTIQSGCNQTIRFLLCKKDISRFALGGNSVLALHTSFPDRFLTPEVNYIYSPFISSIYTQGNANANQKEETLPPQPILEQYTTDILYIQIMS